MFASPSSRLGELVSGASATASALAQVAPTLNALFADTATTFAALKSSALGSAIDQLPRTEAVATTTLTRSLPALSEAAQLEQALRPSAGLLPVAATRLDAIVTAATPVFTRVPTLASKLQGAVAAVQALARDPASQATFKGLGSNDLATFAASGLNGLGAILRAVAPSQFACNVAGLWLRNFASGLSEGDSTGSWLRVMPLFDPSESTETATPAPDLHLNYYPIEDSTQCQAGNEGYSGKQLIGNPPKTSTTVDNTAPPPGVLEARRAGGAGASRMTALHVPAGVAASSAAASARGRRDRDLRDGRGHVLRVQPRDPVRASLRAERVRQQQRQRPRRRPGADRWDRCRAGHRRSAPAGQQSKITMTLDKSALPVHKTRRSGSATGCSSRAATTSSSTQARQPAPAISDGGTLPASQTSSPVQFFQFLQSFYLPTRISLDELDRRARPGPRRSPGPVACGQRRRGAEGGGAPAAAAARRHRDLHPRPARDRARRRRQTC